MYTYIYILRAFRRSQLIYLYDDVLTRPCYSRVDTRTPALHATNQLEG